MSSRLCTAAAVIALAASLAACTSGGTTAGNGTDVPTSGAAVDTATSVPATSDAPTPTTTTPSPTTGTTTSRPVVARGPVVPGCTVAGLQIMALPGSGYQGREFAQIVFTNQGRTSCSLYGFPGVSLRLSNAQLGQPASREPVTPTTVVLKPGQQATADITDFSTCNAPLSDTVRVYPPNSRAFVDLPLQLRGCTISVKPVVHG